MKRICRENPSPSELAKGSTELIGEGRQTNRCGPHRFKGRDGRSCHRTRRRVGGARRRVWRWIV
ncbi:hypothetical protein A2U01_0078408 [Trifolium medium]|uniref:Uncharacterized protein n=1 Tax=Trifolium medium TaxID=97028 RepID=A0A392T9N9_9FABA|nr:hypothetical protein [Trifolium medium]